MATIKEVCYRVLKDVLETKREDSSLITIPYIYSILKSGRTRIIERDMRANAVRPSAFLFQTLPCVELIERPIHECPCVPDLGCVAYRTKYKLPPPINGIGGHYIKGVRTLDGQVAISVIDWEGAAFQAGAKYTSKMPTGYIRNQHFWMAVNPIPRKVVSITMLSEDPLAAYAYPSYCSGDDLPEEDCIHPLEREFPIDERLLDAVVASAIQEIRGATPNYPYQRYNNED